MEKQVRAADGGLLELHELALDEAKDEARLA